MYFVNKVVMILSLFFVFQLLKIVNCQVCKIIVDKCDDTQDVCTAGCESMCGRNFGVCVTSKGIAYCHCFNREGNKKHWQKEFREKFKHARDEILKENQEELERQLKEEALDSGEDDNESDEIVSKAKDEKNNGLKNSKNGKKSNEDEKEVKKSGKHTDL